jgi:hypothetical protein
LGEPAPSELAVRRPVVAVDTRYCPMAAGVADGFACSVSAAAPVTWGEAMEVPLRTFEEVVSRLEAEVMPLPGANSCTQAPKFE